MDVWKVFDQKLKFLTLPIIISVSDEIGNEKSKIHCRFKSENFGVLKGMTKKDYVISGRSASGGKTSPIGITIGS